ncbi:MAG: hypothetical protein ACE5ID_11320, partial [Acidobacteriota bacterium]
MIVDSLSAPTLLNLTSGSVAGTPRTQEKAGESEALEKKSSADGVSDHHQDDLKISQAFVEKSLILASVRILDRFFGVREADSPEEEHHRGKGPEAVASRVLRKIARRLEKGIRKLQDLSEELAGRNGTAGDRIPQTVTKATDSLTAGIQATLRDLARLQDDQGRGRRFLDGVGVRLLAGVDSLGRELARAEGSPAARPIPTRTELSVSRVRSFSLEVTTREGDTVVLEVASRTAATGSVEIQGSAGDLTSTTQTSLSRRQELSLTVQGDLNQSETAAIEDLLQRAGELSNSFHGADSGSFFQRALAESVGSGEIASFSLHFHQSLEARVATTYQEIGRLGSGQDGAFRDRAPVGPGPVPEIAIPDQGSLEALGLGLSIQANLAVF